MLKIIFPKVILLSSACLLFSACTPAYNPNLTPEQNKQMQRSSQYNRTMGEGALFGTLLGAATGAVAGKGKGALIGSLAGAAVGTGAGYMVANRTQNQQVQEDQLNKQIAAAHQIAMTAQADAQNASQEVAAAQTQLARLNQQIASKKITTARYKQQLALLQKKSQELNSKVNYYSQQSDQIHHYAQLAQDPRLEQEAKTTDEAVTRLKSAESVLATGLGAQPAGYTQSQG